MAKLEDIYNFIKVNEQLATAGQPKAEQFTMIKDEGYQVIISLATGDTEEDIPDEAEIVEALGLTYHHLPVDWQSPTTQDLETFFDLMAQHDDQKVLVHCIANMRVTAFVTLYHAIKKDVPFVAAQSIMEQVWHSEEDYPIWQTFIKDMLRKYGIEDQA